MYRVVIPLLCLFLVSFSLPNPCAKYQLIVFEGSDWCASCRKLEKNVLSDSTFITFLQTNQIELLKVDFPQRKKQPTDLKKKNEQIAQKYQFKGEFPTLVLTSLEGSDFKQIVLESPSTSQLMQEITAKLTDLGTSKK